MKIGSIIPIFKKKNILENNDCSIFESLNNPELSTMTEPKESNLTENNTKSKNKAPSLSNAEYTAKRMLKSIKVKPVLEQNVSFSIFSSIPTGEMFFNHL